MNITKLHKVRSLFLYTPLFAFLLSGCQSHRAPVITLIGAYFPAWLISFAISIVLTLLMRVIFILLKWDDWIEYKVLFYVSFVFIFAFILTFTLFN